MAPFTKESGDLLDLGLSIPSTVRIRRLAGAHGRCSPGESGRLQDIMSVLRGVERGVMVSTIPSRGMSIKGPGRMTALVPKVR